MNIPDKVKIGWKDFKVIITEPSSVLKSDSLDCYGDIYWEKNEIRLNKANEPDQMECTLVHEILHGISDMGELNLTEDIIIRLANGLYCVIKDNPKMFEVLKE